MNIKKYTVTLVRESSHNYPINSKVTSPEDMVEVIEQVLHLEDQTEEVFGILAFDGHLKVIGVFEVSRGTLSSSQVHPREVFKRALLLNTSKIALFHNHPSGDTTPSKADKQITARLVDCGDILGIKVIDHIIIGENDYYAFSENELL